MLRRLLLLCVAVSACAGGLRKTIREPSAPLELTTAFVYPIRFLGSSEPAWRSFELSERMLGVGVREGGDHLAFFGPTEFKVIQFEAENAWVSTTALPLLTGSGSRADQGAVIRTTVERRVTSSVQEAQNSKGQGGATSSELTTFIGRVELIHPMTLQTLIEVEGQATVDPFAEPTPELEFDPAPALTSLLERLMAEVISVAVKHSKLREVSPDFGFTMATTPQSALSLRTDPAIAAEVLQLDALQREVLLENIARVLSPWLSGKPLIAVANSPSAGLAIVAVPPGSGKLAPGDVIETVDGAAALPHVLARGRFKGSPVELRVLNREGATREVVLP